MTFLSASAAVYAFNASRPTVEERSDINQMKLRQNFTIEFRTCQPTEGMAKGSQWARPVAKVALRFNPSETGELAEGIRELVLLTNRVTGLKGTVETFASGNGQKVPL